MEERGSVRERVGRCVVTEGREGGTVYEGKCRRYCEGRKTFLLRGDQGRRDGRPLN